jgi:hypothetical protein
MFIANPSGLIDGLRDVLMNQRPQLPEMQNTRSSKRAARVFLWPSSLARSQRKHMFELPSRPPPFGFGNKCPGYERTKL